MTLDGKFKVADRDWYWDINAIAGRNKAKQTMFGNINAANLPLALGPVGSLHRPCVPFNIFGGVGSITQAMLDYVTFVQDDSSEQKLWGVGQFDRQPVRVARWAIRVRTAGSSIATRRGASIPIRWSRRGSVPTFRRSPPRAVTTSTRPMPESVAPLFSDRPFCSCSNSTPRRDSPDYSASGSTTTFKAGVNWKPIRDLRLRGIVVGRLPRADHRRIVRNAVALRPGNRRSLLGRPNPSGTIAPIAPAHGVPPGYQQNNPQISVLTSGNEDLKPETSTRL